MSSTPPTDSNVSRRKKKTSAAAMAGAAEAQAQESEAPVSALVESGLTTPADANSAPTTGSVQTPLAPPALPVLAPAPGEAPPAVSATDDDDDEPLDPTLPIPKGAQALAVLEAFLFSATTPLNARRLGRLLNGVDPQTVLEWIGQLRALYAQSGRGIDIMEVAGGFQLGTRPEFSEWIFRLHRHRKKAGISPAVLETLAITAYKQPITRADIEAIRGVDCGGILRQLQDMGLVEVVGKREVPGRPPLYGTTDLFLKSFGLRRLADLPSLEELQLLLTRQENSLDGQGELFAPEHFDEAEAAAAGALEEAQTGTGAPEKPDEPELEPDPVPASDQDAAQEPEAHNAPHD